jgi:hypothetical protein
LNIDLRELIDALSRPLEIGDIEDASVNPIRVIGLQRFENGRLDIANVQSLKKRPFPGVVAGHAFVDQPSVELSTIGVQPDLVARSKGFERAAPAAYDPRLGGDFRRKGPLDLENMAHTVLAFRTEVHQDGGVISPVRARRGGVVFDVRAETASAARGAFNNAKPVSDPPSDEQARSGLAITRYPADERCWTRPVFTMAKRNLNASSSSRPAIAGRTST